MDASLLKEMLAAATSSGVDRRPWSRPKIRSWWWQWGVAAFEDNVVMEVVAVASVKDAIVMEEVMVEGCTFDHSFVLTVIILFTIVSLLSKMYFVVAACCCYCFCRCCWWWYLLLLLFCCHHHHFVRSIRFIIFISHIYYYQ